MANKLKLFIWTDFSPDYTGGLAFAIARDENEARKLITKQHGYDPDDWGELEIRRIDYRVGRSVGGGG